VDFHVPWIRASRFTASANLVMGKWFEDTIPNDRALAVAEEKPGLSWATATR